MRKTGIVILNYKNIEDTFRCIESIEKYVDGDGFKIVVVDNGSGTSLYAKLKEYIITQYSNKSFFLNENENISKTFFLPYITVLALNKNYGYAAGNNFGMNLLFNDQEIENIMILNNDILFIEDIISDFSKQLEQHPDLGIITPILLKMDGKSIDLTCGRKCKSIMDIVITYTSLRHLPHFKKRMADSVYRESEYLNHPMELMDIDLPSGSCLMGKKKIWKKVNGFDPHTFLYFEEDILKEKLDKIGLKIMIATKRKCIHIGSQSMKKFMSPGERFKTRDSALYFLKVYRHAPSALYYYLKIRTRISMLFYSYILLPIGKSIKKRLYNNR